MAVTKLIVLSILIITLSNASAPITVGEIRRLLLNDTTTTVTPITTVTPTTTASIISTVPSETEKSYGAGINGYVERGSDWVNNDATDTQLLMICAIFAVILVLLLCCCYIYQCRKTRNLMKTLYSFNPEALQNNREKQKQKQKLINDVPFIDAADPDSSLGHNHQNGDVIAPAHAEVVDVEPPDDDEANYRKSNPNGHNQPGHNQPGQGVPNEENLEESISIEESNDKALELFAGAAPPPPQEPVPKDILNKHRQRAATLQNKNKNKNRAMLSKSGNHLIGGPGASLNENASKSIPARPASNSRGRGNTYHHGINGAKKQKKKELEMQKLPQKKIIVQKLDQLERVKTESKVARDDDDPPTPVSSIDGNNPLIAASDVESDDDKSNKNGKFSKRNSLRNMQSKRLSKSGMLPLANKRNNNDPALALLAEDKPMMALMDDPSSPSMDPRQQQSLINEKAKAIKKEKEKEKPKAIEDDDPFSSIEAEFNALSHSIDDIESDNKLKSQASGNDVILGIFSGEEVDSKPQSKPKPKPKPKPHKAEASGNDVILDIFSNEPQPEKEEKKGVKKESEPQHRGKQDGDDPFASLDMSPDEFLSSSSIKKDPEPPKQEQVKPERKDKDAEAMGMLGGLLSANPEFGDENNIFGGNNKSAVDAVLNNQSANGGNNIVDYDKFNNVPDVVPVDYSKLTAISDTDQYKVVSVEETVISEDANGNIKQSVDKKMNDENETTELDNILQNNMENPDDNVQVIAEDIAEMEAELNMSSPLDALMNEAQKDNDKPDKNQQEEDDPFGGLNNDPFASPLDSLMAASAPQQQEEEEEEEEEEEDKDKGFNQLSSPLDAIMTNAAAAISPSSGSSADESETPLVSKNEPEVMMMNKPMVHQTIDIDNFMAQTTMYNAVHSNEEIKEEVEIDDDDEDEEDDDDEDENAESLGSEIIHETPRNSALIPHEPLDPGIFGKDESEETSSEEESYGTDPNGY